MSVGSCVSGTVYLETSYLPQRKTAGGGAKCGQPGAAGRETLLHLGRVREFQKGFDMGMRKLLLEPFNQEGRNINFSLANNPGFPGDT